MEEGCGGGQDERTVGMEGEEDRVDWTVQMHPWRWWRMRVAVP